MNSPISGKPMKLLRREERLSFRKDVFSYVHNYYLCEDSSEEFTTTVLDELNIVQVYNKYRDKHNLPFPDEIVAFRERFKLSASRISKILGLGINSYRNYENGEVPSLSNGKLIQNLISTPISFKTLVLQCNEISSDDRDQLLKIIDFELDKSRQSIRSRKASIERLHSNNLLPDIYSGYVKSNVDKLGQMLIYFAHNMKPTVTAMNKLLWYADFLNFKRTGFSITGTRYYADYYGPVPTSFRTIFEFFTEKQDVQLREYYFGNRVGEAFECSDSCDPNLDVFSIAEVETLNEVLSKFKNCNATNMKDLSHEELAWLDNEKDRGGISYNYAFHLKHV